MFPQLLTISRNTFTESIRQPIFAVLVFVAVLGLVLNPLVSAYTMGDDNKLLIDLGLSTLFVAGLFMAAFTAAGVLNREIENKTVLTVISKPVSRPLFVLGKYLGTTAALTLGLWSLSLIFLLTVRHKVATASYDPFDTPVLTFGILALLAALIVATVGNYFFQWVFSSSFVICFAVFETIAWVLVMLIDKHWQFQSPLTDIDGQLLLGMVLLFQAILIIAAVAIAASTRLGQVMTLVICFVVFGLGLINDPLLGERMQRSGWAELFYRLVPNIQFLWPADALTQGNDFTLGYVAMVSAYTAFIIGAILSLAVLLFQTREVG